MIGPDRFHATNPEEHLLTDEQLVRGLDQRVANNVDAAVRTAIKTALLGPLPFMTLIVVATIILPDMSNYSTESVGDKLVGRVAFGTAAFFWTAIIGGLYVLMAGISCGWLAHRFTFNTNTSTTLMARLLVWVANLSLWGWAMVIAITDS